jgi:hypothetical protein
MFCLGFGPERPIVTKRRSKRASFRTGILALLASLPLSGDVRTQALGQGVKQAADDARRRFSTGASAPS